MRNCFFRGSVDNGDMAKRVNEWIADRLRELGKKNKDLADAIHVERPRITELIKGARRLSSSELPAFAHCLEMSVGEVYKKLTKNSPQYASVFNGSDIIPTHIRVIGFLQAGTWQEAVEWHPDDYYEVPVFDARYPPDGLYGLEIRGDSMNLVYPEKTVVVCRADDPVNELPPINRNVVVQRRDKTGLFEATVKRLESDEQGRGWLIPQSTNASHKPIPYKTNGDGDDDTQITGIVIASYRPE